MEAKNPIWTHNFASSGGDDIEKKVTDSAELEQA